MSRQFSGNCETTRRVFDRGAFNMPQTCRFTVMEQRTSVVGLGMSVIPGMFLNSVGPHVKD